MPCRPATGTARCVVGSLIHPSRSVVTDIGFEAFEAVYIYIYEAIYLVQSEEPMRLGFLRLQGYAKESFEL